MGGRASGPVFATVLMSLAATGCPVLVSEDQVCEIRCDGVCVTQAGVCDGVDDCADGRDEEHGVCYPPVSQELIIVDDCHDGLDTEWRVWATERAWVWPSVDSTFFTNGLGYESYEVIECDWGEELCFGAAADDVSWGVGIDGDVGCDTCCWTCAPDLVDLGFLTCD